MMTNNQKPIKLKTKTVKTITVQDWENNHAQKLIEATERYTLRPQRGDRARVIAAVLRELVNQLKGQYEIEDYFVDEWYIDVKDILKICDELELEVR